MKTRLPFEVDERIEPSLVTAHAGIPLALDLFRASGPATDAEQANEMINRGYRVIGMGYDTLLIERAVAELLTA